MQNSFWDIVGISSEIKTIEKGTLREALVVAYSDDGYLLHTSSWFIDIKGGFRIFRHADRTYIAKETNENKAHLEVANSKRAKKKLEGQGVGVQKIGIVVPDLIKLRLDKERFFLVSEHFSSDLNEHVYRNTKPNLSLNDCLSIVKILLENGIIHRGFLPRNIVEKENTIYLFDWEDAIFGEKPILDGFDHLWKTNFLLNWSYLFGFEKLDLGLKNCIGMTYPLSESPLVRYENTFKDITNSTDHVKELRNDIDKIVFGAELPLDIKIDHFYIRPNDMGHLIADIFPSEIDVLHDILTYVFRKHDEHKFSLHTQFTTNLLIEYFKIASTDNTFNLPLKYFALIPILMMLDNYISEEQYLELISTTTLSQLTTKISELIADGSVTRTFLSGEERDFPKLLDVAIQNKIKEVCPKMRTREDKSIDLIVRFIENESIVNQAKSKLWQKQN